MHPQFLLHTLDYLTRFILARLDHYFGAESAGGSIHYPAPPSWEQYDTPLACFICEHELSRDETVVLLLGLAPHLQPNYYEAVLLERLPQSGDFPEFGGVKGKQYRGILPTGESALFVLAGADLARRLSVQSLFEADLTLYKTRVLWLEDPIAGEPLMSGKIILNPEYIELFITGKVAPPKFSTEFPAKKIQTRLEWDDLVLPSDVKQQIQDLETWIKYNDTLLNDWGMAKRIKPGYRVLFYGPPGTGKTMTASLLGKYTRREVYRIDLSTVVSKYIGETEKNLASLFDRAEDKSWILFFDEADSLFGKRTNVRDAHDKYANQEVSYLLQRIEDFNGLVILASNFKSNIDDAFMRRFNAVIKFPLPDRKEREEIWMKSLPEALVDTHTTASQNQIRMISKYELTGGQVINVAQYASLKCLANKNTALQYAYLVEGIKREYEKEGKVFSE